MDRNEVLAAIERVARTADPADLPTLRKAYRTVLTWGSPVAALRIAELNRPGLARFLAPIREAADAQLRSEVVHE